MSILKKIIYVVIIKYLLNFSSAIAMEKEHVTPLLQALAKTTYISGQSLSRNSCYNSMTDLEITHETAFKQALLSDSRQTALEALAKPVSLERSDIQDGKLFVRKSSYRDARTNYALGLLALERNELLEAQDHFKQAERAALYKPQEAPIESAAAFARLLLDNQRDLAFIQHQELCRLASLYPSCKPLVGEHQALLKKMQYLPLLEQLAKTGSVDDRYDFLVAACMAAAKETTTALCYKKITACMPYLDSLDEYPEFRPLLDRVRTYARVASGMNDAGDDTVLELIDFLEEKTQDAHLLAVNKLIETVLHDKRDQGNMPATLYLVFQDIQSTQKQVRARGFAELTKLLLHLPCDKAVNLRRLLERFTMLSHIEKSVLQNNNLAALTAYVQIEALALFIQPNLFFKTVEGRKECERLRKLALTVLQKKELKKGDTQTSLEYIVKGLEGLIGYAKNDLSFFIQRARSLQDVKTAGGVLNCMQQQAGRLLADLAQEGNVDALVWRACKGAQQAQIDAEAKEHVRVATVRFLEVATEDQLKEQCGRDLQDALTKVIEKSNDSELRFLLSRLLFCKAHLVINFTQEPKKFDECFALAAKASKDGIHAAKSFVQFLVRYRAAIGLLAQRKDDQAVDVLDELLALDLPMRERALVHDRFAYSVMQVAAGNNNLKAQEWCLNRWSTSNDPNDNDRIVITMYQACKNLVRGATICKSEEALKRLYTLATIPLLMERLEYCRVHDTDPVMSTKASIALSFCLSLKARSCNQDLASGKLADSTAWQAEDFAKPLMYMKEAVAMLQQIPLRDVSAERKKELTCIKDTCYVLGGDICMHAGQLYLQKNETKAAQAILDRGILLGHPHCLRMHAALCLHQPDPMDKETFQDCIKKLELAYQGGDEYAGAILAQHYFDGKNSPFGCGWYFSQQENKAYELALAIGPRYKETQRILGIYHIKRAKKMHDQDERKAVALELAISYLKDACENGCQAACLSLYELTRLEICSPAQQEDIKKYFAAKDTWPVALLCYGNLLHKEVSTREAGIAYIRKARSMSDGCWGNVELLEYHAGHREKGLSQDALFEAADCAISILSDKRVDLQENKPVLNHIMQLVPLLYLESIDPTHQEYTDRFNKITRLLEEKGVECTVMDMTSAESAQKKIQEGWQTITKNDIVDAGGHSGTMTLMAQKKGAISADFLAQLEQISQRLDKLSSKEAIKISEDEDFMQALEEGILQGNVLAQSVMSIICLHKAQDAQKTLDQSLAYYTKSLTLMLNTLVADADNPVYGTLFKKVFLAVCNFYVSKYIAYQMHNASFMKTTYEHMCTCLRECLKKEHEDKELLRAIDDCFYALACTGYVPALERCIEKGIAIGAGQDLDKALSAICRSLFASEIRTIEQIEESGIVPFIDQYSVRIKELAENKNPYAAQFMLLWPVLCDRIKKPLPPEQVQEIVKKLPLYSTLAEKKSDALGQYCVYSMPLLTNQKCSSSDFKKNISALESLQDKELVAAELLLQLQLGVTLPCGKSLPCDTKKAKKIAVKIRDKSIIALRVLQVMAHEDKRHDIALLLKVEETNRMGCQDAGLYDLARQCIAARVYPPEALSLLQKRASEDRVVALLALSNIAIARKEFDCAVDLLSKVRQLSDVHECYVHFAMALVCLEQDSAYFNIENALEHVTLGMQKRLEHGVHRLQAVQALKLFGQAVIAKLKNALIANDVAVKQSLERGLEQVCDCLHEPDCFDHSLDTKLIKLAYCCITKHDYHLLVQEMNNIIALYKEAMDKILYKETMADVVTILLSHLYAQMHEQKKANGKIAGAIQWAINSLTDQAQKLDLK